MTNTIDELAENPGTLRKVTLAGPMVEADGKRRPMWILSAGSPSFNYKFAFDANGRKSGVTADHAHPIRILAAEQPGPAPRRWMQPSLISVHLVLGAENFQYKELLAEEEPVDDGLLFEWIPGKQKEVDASGGVLCTRTEGLDESKGHAPFVQVATQLLPTGLPDNAKRLPGDWMEEHAADRIIPVPPMRLVAGRIGIHARLSEDRDLRWLARLGIVAAKEEDDFHTWPTLWLTPDGIEFEARLPFPGRPGAAPLQGRVLLHPDPVRKGKFRLTLVEATEPQAWLAAWYDIVPAGGDATESLLGLKFAARRDGALPAFSWQVEHDENGPSALAQGAQGTVWVAARDCELQLTSPRTGGGFDSVAALRLAELKVTDVSAKDELGKDVNYVEFQAQAGALSGAIACTCLCTPGRVALRVGGGRAGNKVSLDIDAGRLAEELREAYGLPTPPAVPMRRAPGIDYGAAYGRPLLPAFVPLDEGWLQLPVPNLGPLDTGNDLALGGGGASASASVLNGFLRMRQSGLGDAVQSAYHPERQPLPGQDAPWSLTVEQAVGADARVRLLPRAAVSAAHLVEASVVLHGAVISARGLLWLSADRPDADEALPRLGAGPNSFLDAHMHSAGAAGGTSPLFAGVDSLEASMTREPGKAASLDWKRMSLWFRTGSERWVGELLKPHEARTALSEACKCIRAGELPPWTSNDPDAALAVVRSHAHSFRAELTHASLHYRKLAEPLDLLKAIPAIKKQVDAAAGGLAAVTETAAGALPALHNAQKVLDQARDRLALEPPAPLAPRAPWPAVAWLRHPVLPLAATMPMTRAAAGGPRPLESRELFPLALLGPEAVDQPPPLLVLAGLVRRADSPLPGLDEKAAFTLTPLPSWPHPRTLEADPKAPPPDPERGIAMASVGVPGVELRVLTAPATGKPAAYEAALRYDLPLLDEAFATATLPPPAGATPQQAPVLDSVATALDWPLMARLWARQERKHQNARVVDSYVCGYRAVDANPQEIDILSLVRGLVWKAEIGFTTRTAPGKALSYGSVSLASWTASANDALAGYGGAVSPAISPWQQAPLTVSAPAKLSLLGFSPATIKVKEMELDNSMSGALDPVPNDLLIERRLAVGGAGGSRLVTLAQAESIAIGGHTFQFWFKDLLFENDTATLDKWDAEMAFDSADKDARLAAAGGEWRLAPADALAAEATLRLGRSELPFCGLRLEPLRLTALKVADGRLSEATLVCRLILDPRADGPNFVELVLSRNQPQDPLEATLGLLDAGTPLVFNANATDPQAGRGLPQRRVRVTATPAIAAGRPQFKDVGFEIEVAGRMVRAGDADIVLPSAQAGYQLVRVIQKAAPPAAGDGDARLRIAAAELCAGYTLDKRQGLATLSDIAPTLTWERHVEIFAGVTGKNEPALRWTLGARPSMTLFGMALGDFDAHVDEGNGVLALTVNDQQPDLSSAPEARLGAALLVRLGQDSGQGAAALSAGSCRLTLLQVKAGDKPQELVLGSGVRISEGKADISVWADTGGRWSGVAVLDAVIVATSDIRWPALRPGVGAKEIPLPKNKREENNGRVRVLPAGGDPALHTVRWVLSGHRLPLSLAASLMSDQGTEAWVTPVAAHHCLSRGQRQVAWTSIESLAIGRRSAIVPPLPASLTDDAKTLTTRYAHAIVGGQYQSKPEAGMLKPGIGAVATVLQGTLGREFREQFWKEGHNDALLFAGGFLGQLDTGGASAPLLRLPVLAGSGLRIEQSGVVPEGVELAWHDGPAARALARTRPTAPAPANASYEALGAALLAGSLTGASSAAGDDEVYELAGAMLVEQSYAVTPAGQPTTLKASPFFLAAAVTVSAVLDAMPDGEKREAASLSLVGGRLHRSGRSHALTASVAMQPTIPVLARSARRSTLFVLGQASKDYRWERGLPPGGEETLIPYLRRLAPSYDHDPAGVLFVGHPGDDLPRYLAGAIVPPGLEGLGSGAGSPAAFGDGRRGPCTAPAERDLLRWLAPPREGAAGPVRDAKHIDNRWTGSGIAGLARRMALAAHAGASWAPSDAAAAPQLVWLSSTQVPVYLPLRIAGLRGVPVGWLQQATPQVRLPIGREVNETLAKSRQPAPAGAEDTFPLQGFLPEALSHAAVGERAGIVTLRRSRLLARLDGEGAAVPAYDAAYARFGAPAQAGSSWPRKLRTPRPGPLPENTGDASRDRRVQASYVRPLDPGSATIGSADIVQGGPGSFKGFKGFKFSAWSVEVCAMPESASLVSERWDSTLRLACRVEVRRDRTNLSEPAITPADFLASALFGDPKDDGKPEKANTEVLLKVGDASIPYRWLELSTEAGVPGWKQVVAPAWRTDTATVILVLDARPTAQRGGAAFAPFVQALEAAGPRPSLELQWTVLPRSSGKACTLSTAAVELGLVPPPYPSLVAGSTQRPSLTLRFPLYPVRQARGALPLTPATLVFSDPAYDRELAGIPAVTRTRLAATVPADLDARGELGLVLYADRASVNRRGVLTVMADIAYERRLDELAQALAEAAFALPGGDLIKKDVPPPLARIGLRLIPVDGPARPLRFKRIDPDKGPLVETGTVYELPLSQLTEENGTPARLRAGDVLQVDAALGFDEKGEPQSAVQLELWHNANGKPQAATLLTPTNSAPHSLLAITLTDEAVAEPPAALYLALQRSGADDATRLSVPLHAQSPLPRRLDLMDAARGFRQGLLRRHADFVWYLNSTDARLGAHALAPVKSDRNGQAYFPTSAAEFLTPVRFSPPKNKQE